MLDVDHISSRLNFLLPRYQNIKGQNLSVPGKESKRSQKSKVFVVPEFCSIHPLPGYLWRQLFILPAVLYRVESLLVAEEFRSSVASALGKGAVDWPNDVPLPQLTLGEMVGEEVLSQINSFAKDLRDKASPEMDTNKPTSRLTKLAGEEIGCPAESTTDNLRDKPSSGVGADKPIVLDSAELVDKEIVSQTADSGAQKSTDELRKTGRENIAALQDTQLLEMLAGVRICEEEKLNMTVIEERLPAQKQNSNESNNDTSTASRCDLITKSKTSFLSASSEVDWREAAKVDISDSEGVCVTEEDGAPPNVDRNEVNSETSNITIWTDPLLSRLYQTCGPPSTLILRALTICAAGDVFSLERLELLGDSFVKYAVSSSVFFRYRHENEGKLSFIRGLNVSNRQLFYLARQRGLPLYIVTRMFNPLVNWLPPGFYYEDTDDAERATDGQLLLMPDMSSQNVEEEDEDGNMFVQEELSGIWSCAYYVYYHCEELDTC